MKFGMNLLLWTTHLDRPHSELLRQIRSWGYQGVEVPLFSLDQLDTAWAAGELRAAGLAVTTVTALPPEANLVGETEREQRAGIAHLRRSIELTRQIGATLLCGPVYSPVGRLLGRGRTAEEWKRAVLNFREVAGMASANGVRVAVEPLNRFETYVLNTAADTCALVDEVGSESLGVQLDTFHANIEEKNSATTIESFADSFVHVHISESDRGTPGTGQVHWDEVFRALKKVKYDDWLVIEAFGRALPDLAAATRVWRDLFPSAEEVYTKGLRFMKEKWAAAKA